MADAFFLAFMREYKVVVVGSGGVGKSALTVQFVQGHFVTNYDATIEDSYRKHLQLDGRDARVEILDTAGTEQFSGMRDLYIKSGQGFILVYSIDDLHSLRDLLPIYKLITHIKGTQEVCSYLWSIIVQLAKEWGCPFFESSAKLNHNVHEVFADVCRQIERQRQSAAPRPKKRTLRLPGARPQSDKSHFGKSRRHSPKDDALCCSIM